MKSNNPNLKGGEKCVYFCVCFWGRGLEWGSFEAQGRHYEHERQPSHMVTITSRAMFFLFEGPSHSKINIVIRSLFKTHGMLPSRASFRQARALGRFAPQPLACLALFH